MEEYETLEQLFRNLDLTDIEAVLGEAYHSGGPGRPPRKPLGLFKAFLVKHLLGIRGIRELERRLENDERLRNICDLEADERAYGRSVLSRFPKRVGVERLQRILSSVRRRLVEVKVIRGVDVSIDGSYIKAYSRIEMKTRLGFSDPDARVGRSSHGYGLGYTLHLTADSKSELPISFRATPANVRETTVARSILIRTQQILRKMRRLMADRGYSSDPLREYVRNLNVEPIIPYTSRQRPGLKGVLRIDKQFKPHGPTRLKYHYKKRSSIERLFSRLEELDVDRPKVRGLRNVTMHIQLCIITLLLNALAAYNAGNPKKIRSLKYYAN